MRVVVGAEAEAVPVVVVLGAVVVVLVLVGRGGVGGHGFGGLGRVVRAAAAARAAVRCLRVRVIVLSVALAGLHSVRVGLVLVFVLVFVVAGLPVRLLVSEGVKAREEAPQLVPDDVEGPQAPGVLVRALCACMSCVCVWRGRSVNRTHTCALSAGPNPSHPPKLQIEPLTATGPWPGPAAASWPVGGLPS